MIINITFRRESWELSKIYAIGGGVVEGVEDIREYQFVVLVHKMHLRTTDKRFQSDYLKVGQGTEGTLSEFVNTL